MKFDEVYDFQNRPEGRLKCSKIELALKFLSEAMDNQRKWRLGEIKGIGGLDFNGQIENQFISTIDFTKDDIMEFLISEGKKVKI